ncbi:DNA internalization-related competence protein ComEC/Rec2 [Chakrabartyella piscis]|uniref:DNA internalization-related competence protein ComEC/Rec2 n=1 Tax=Chakrabartyella piscis TaxID=2918914 RepID=UPI0029585ED2|nr:DNA internalization-related competence protein ComEC/Rec2 [Chakrabartyella piscis]
MVICICTLRFVIKREWDGMILLVVFVTLGIIRSGSAIDVNLEKVPSHNYTATVTDVMITGENTQRLLLDMDVESTHGVVLVVPYSEDEAYMYSIGERIRFKGELEDLSPASRPNGFDPWLYYLTKGIGYSVYPERLESLGMVEESKDIWLVFARWKESLFGVLDTYLLEIESSIAKAVLAGEKDYIANDTLDLYERCGIQHMLCVSGLHIALFTLYLHTILERVFRIPRKPLILCTIAASIVYVLFTGAAPSSIRAVIMGNMVLVGHLIGRKSTWWNNVAIAALVILCIQPLYLFQGGVQLSFVTVIGLWVARSTLPEDANIRQKSYMVLRSCVYASLFSYPVVAYYFYSISLIGILVNMVVLPVLGVLLGCLVLLSISGFLIPPLAPVFASMVKLIILYIDGVCIFADSVPNGYVLVGSPSLATIFLAYGFMFCVFLYGNRFCNWKTAICFGFALWFSIYGNELIYKRNLVTFLDVDQGDCIIVSTYDGHAVMIDGGGWYGSDIGGNVGVDEVVPYLEYLGIGELDGMFITHLDLEHVIGAVEVLDVLPVKSIYFTPYPQDDLTYWWLFQVRIAKNNVLLYTLEEGMITPWQDGVWECLYPIPDVSFVDGNENHGSLVMRYSYGGTSVLLTGDITKEDEELLLERQGENLRSDILQLPAHGSSASGSLAFLEGVEAEMGIISCGLDNIYGYPDGSVLKNLGYMDTDVYRTDQMGSILLYLSPDGSIDVECVKERDLIYERIKKAVEEWRI